MKQILAVALGLILMLSLGCIGEQAVEQAAPIDKAPVVADRTEVPAAPPKPALPEAAPAPPENKSDGAPFAAAYLAPAVGLSWDSKNAQKISMLKEGEKMSSPHFILSLDKIEQGAGVRLAHYSLVSITGEPLGNFSLAGNSGEKIGFKDGSQYLIVAVFPIGEGYASSVQTQIYEVKSIEKSTSGIEVGQPENAYNIDKMYPAPEREKTDVVSLGGKVDLGDFQVELSESDRTVRPAVLKFRAYDPGGAEISSFKLSPGQMVSIHMKDGTRHAFVLRKSLDDGSASVDVYKITLFLRNSASN